MPGAGFAWTGISFLTGRVDLVGVAILEMTLYGDPKAKARPRKGTNGHMFTPSSTTEAEKIVATFARHELGEGWEPVDQPVGMAVQFYCQTRRHTDGDNLFKLVTDALNQIVYTDDYLIEEFFVRVIRGVGKAEARTEIMVYLL